MVKAVCRRAPLAGWPAILAVLASVGAAAPKAPSEVEHWAERLSRILPRIEAAASEHPDMAALRASLSVFYALSQEMNCYVLHADEPCGWQLPERGRFVEPMPIEAPASSPAGGCYAFSNPHRLDGTLTAGEHQARRITLGLPLLERIGDDGAICTVVAHEIGHIALGHAAYGGEGRTDGLVAAPVADALSREDEYEADRFAIEVGLAAGLGYRELLDGVTRLAQSNADSGEPGFSTHPSWPERFARLDEPNRHYWRCLGSFDVGVACLARGDYEAAYARFEQAATELPNEAQPASNEGAAALLAAIDRLGERRRDGLLAGGGGIPAPPWFGELTAPLRTVGMEGFSEWLARAREGYARALEIAPGLEEAEVGMAIVALLGESPDAAACESRLRGLLPDDPSRLTTTTLASLTTSGMVAARLAGASLDPWVVASGRLVASGAAPPASLVANLARVARESGQLPDDLDIHMLLSCALETTQSGAPLRGLLVQHWAALFPGEPAPEAARRTWRQASAFTLTVGDATVELRIPTTERRLAGALAVESTVTPVAGADNLKTIHYPSLGLRLYCGAEDGITMAVLLKPTGYVALRPIGEGSEVVERLELGATRGRVRALLGVRKTAPMLLGDSRMLYYGEPGIAVQFAGKGDEAIVTALALIPN